MNPEDPLKRLSKLTERQRDVLRLFCDGLDYKTISKRLYIEVSTVKAHMGHIYIKLDIDHLPPAKRKVVLVKEYCPLLRKVELPPAPPDETDEPEPVPEPIMKIIEEDERTFASRRLLEPSRRPRGLRWLLVGVILGACLVVVLTASTMYALRGFLSQFIEEPTLEYVVREVTVEVTSAPAPSQPSPTAVVQTQEATATQEEVVVTATPEDTPTPVPPTPTPAPTNTPVPPTPTVPKNTPPGSVLEVGESWKQNDVELKLIEAYLGASSECLALRIDFYNNTHHQMVVTIAVEDFSVVDNLGRRWQAIGLFDNYKCYQLPAVADNMSRSRTVDAGDNFGAQWVSFAGFVTDTSVDEVIVTVNLSQISSAKWRVPIYN